MMVLITDHMPHVNCLSPVHALDLQIKMGSEPNASLFGIEFGSLSLHGEDVTTTTSERQWNPLRKR